MKLLDYFGLIYGSHAKRHQFHKFVAITHEFAGKLGGGIHT